MFGLPAWLAYFRDGQDKTPAAAAASAESTGDVRTVTQVATTMVPTEPESGPDLQRSATHTFPGPYLGIIWIRIGGDGDGDDSVGVSLSWGAKHRTETVDVGDGPVYLTTTKNGTDETPLHVALNRPAEIEFGTEAPPSSAATVSIDRGWTS